MKNYFKLLLERVSQKFFLVILLGKVLCFDLLVDFWLTFISDAIEIFFVNSHQNGATSWIPRDLPANVKIIITFTTEPDEDSREKSKFLQGFSKGVTEAYNMLHLGELGAELSEKVLKYWMDNINRQLTNYQVAFLIIIDGKDYINNLAFQVESCYERYAYLLPCFVPRSVLFTNENMEKL